MRLGISIAALAILCAPAARPQYRLSSAGAPPDGLPPALAAAVEPAGIRIEAAGKVWCELWAAKALQAGAKSAEEAVSLPSIPHGALLGVVRFPAQAQDRRGNPVAPGLYTMRYSLYPADGNHMGVAPQRDFAILISAAKDKSPETMLAYDALMALSREANGTPHPICLSLSPSTETAVPLLKQEEKDWVLHLRIGGRNIAVIVVGKAEG